MKGMRHGMDVAVNFMRVGNLRIAALPFEKDEYPYDTPIRPLKGVMLVLKSWWKERK